MLVAALTACSSAAPGLYPVSQSAVMLEVPIIHQDQLYDCGMAAISALCAYYAVLPNPEQSAELATRAEASHGLSGGEVRVFLEAQGFEVLLFRGTLDHSETGALRHLDAGRPLLVMISFDNGTLFHYCLLVGYDPGLDSVHLLDPRRGLVMLPTQRFDQVWQPSERFCMIALPDNEKSARME
jgi:ABC-type bacteriocin/lantibiotic exporter with double-glycine peptidase domain